MVWDIAQYLKIFQTKVKRYSFDDHYNLLNLGDFLKDHKVFLFAARKKIILMHLINTLRL